ncbi:MAG TPA: hypothetical protein VFC78_09100 [Tepidisphaeraceae bacterium]|nr:hypothetical protein [Tepidisphaeraceae bacterium]
MSIVTQELLSICEQLPDAKRVELADFARFLLASNGDAPQGAAERWLSTARGAAMAGVTTDGVMAMTRTYFPEVELISP